MEGLFSFYTSGIEERGLFSLYTSRWKKLLEIYSSMIDNLRGIICVISKGVL